MLQHLREHVHSHACSSGQTQGQTVGLAGVLLPWRNYCAFYCMVSTCDNMLSGYETHDSMFHSIRTTCDECYERVPFVPEEESDSDCPPGLDSEEDEAPEPSP
jgi:hypothetical protein